MEGMIDQVARTRGLDPDTVRRANLYKKDQVHCHQSVTIEPAIIWGMLFRSLQ